MTITLTVAGRIATVDATTHVVAGNTYPVALSLDSDWTGSLYLRVRFGSLYYDIPFASSATSVDVQMPVGYPEVGIGVYSEALEICTSEARVRLLRSILEAGEQVVEFDSDLYDQWAGEVSELLCDDAFDSTSDRPVKNSVITAWKDTVPLDANLVHKTGAESIAGVKTFEGQGIQAEGSNAYVTLKSTRDASAQSWKGNVLCYDKKDGADSEVGRVAITTGNGFNSVLLRPSKPDRSATYSLEVRAYPEYSVTMVAPFYPVDGQGNPTYLTANALMASGNIAVDPRIVHTTGTEIIAGDKTLTGKPTIKASAEAYLDLTTNKGYQTEGYKHEIRIYDQKDGASTEINRRIVGTSAGSQYNYVTSRLYNFARDNSIILEQRAFSDHGMLVMPTYYPVDGQGNPQALTANAYVTSGNVAVDPRIVHTTGNETVAGTKTFSSGVNAYPAGWHTISKSMTVGQYCVFARINPANLGPGHFHIADFVQSSNTSNCYGRLMFKADRTGPLPMWIYRKNVGSNSPLDVGNIVVLTDASTVYLAWKKTATYGTLVSREVMDINYGGPQSLGGASNIQYYAQADMTILDNLDGYTVYEVTE